MRIAKLASGLAVAWLSSCSSPTVTFDATVTGNSMIPGSSVPIDLGGTLPGFGQFNLAQQANFANQGTDKDHVRHVKVKSLTLTARAPATDLSFFTSLSFTLGAQGLPDQPIAHQTVFPAGQASVQMVVENVDLVSYAKADTIAIKSTAQGHSPRQDTTVDLVMVLTIEAAIL